MITWDDGEDKPLGLVELDQQDQALGGTGQRVAAQRTDQLSPAFRPVIDQLVASVVLVEQRDEPLVLLA